MLSVSTEKQKTVLDVCVSERYSSELCWGLWKMKKFLIDYLAYVITFRHARYCVNELQLSY